MEWSYETTLSVSECFNRLLGLQPVADDDFDPANVSFSKLSDSRLYMVYKGRRFSKSKRTEFTLDISTVEPTSTRITVRFVRELFNCPLPMTSVSEIDKLLKEKISAYRIDKG